MLCFNLLSRGERMETMNENKESGQSSSRKMRLAVGILILVGIFASFFVARYFFRHRIEINEMSAEGLRYMEEKNWSEARSHFEKALEIAEKLSAEDNKDLISKIKFNLAMACFAEGNVIRAGELLLEIKEENPDFDSEKIESWLLKIEGIAGKMSERQIKMDEMNSLLSEAYELKNEGHWTEARMRFEKALEMMEKLSFANKDRLVANTKYGIALSYFNENKLDLAEEFLLEVKEESPDFHAEEIDETLEKIKSMKESTNQ